jgi:DNA-binding IclR family transcriptional regulator
MNAPSKKPKTEAQLVDSVAKALGILDCFSKNKTEMSLNQLCEQTGLYKSRVHRLCGTLIATGYLVKTSRSNYRLGPKLMVLGKVYENTNSLRSIAEPFMKRLSLETGESTALFVLDGMQCMCMARELGSSRLVYAISEGDNMAIAPTASGRALLAFVDEELKAKILTEAGDAESSGEHPVDTEEVERDLRTIREKGYAINKKGIEQGTAAVAAPIFDIDHTVVAALAIVGAVHRFGDEQCDQFVQSLLTATSEMSRLMGEL